MRKISILYLFLALLWTYEITYLSLFLIDDGGEPWFDFPHMDKVGHFGFYFGFVFLWNLFLKSIGQQAHIKYLIISALFYGVLMEVLQHFMPYERTFDVFDILANSIGAIFAVVYIKIVLPRIRSLKTKN